MTRAGVSLHGAANGRRAWVAGGTLLIASAVLGLGSPPIGATFIGGNYFGMGLFTFGILLFAFGFRGSGSVTGRKAVGTIALVVLALWIPLITLVQQVYFMNIESSRTSVAMGLTTTFVQFAVALVAVIQIARAGVVPTPWNWAPSWALAAVVAVSILELVAARTAAQTASDVIFAVAALDELSRTASTIFLGVLALVLANRFGRTVPIAVYQSPERN